MAKDKAFYAKKTLKLKGKIKLMEGALVMGILNINPDSFYDGGRFNSLESALEQARKMIAEGADIIDIGPASSKPGSSLVDPSEEWKIVEPLLNELRTEFPDLPLSLDTYNAATAEKAIHKGLSIVNDISGGMIDPKMIPLIGETQSTYIMMHMKGLPQSMQQNPDYDNVVKEVAYFFSKQLESLAKVGATDVVLDPGFGFGKSLEHNYQLFNNLHYFKSIFEHPLLVGVSRKSMIYKPLNSSPEESLNASTVLHTLALQQGADILRVHDVREAVDVCKILKLNQNFA
ncbi:MAG: dihydropteroate synthase [Bacteroidetes bacterium]|nr:dihydropteroate synthase [Bacteroidota bacterium]